MSTGQKTKVTKEVLNLLKEAFIKSYLLTSEGFNDEIYPFDLYPEMVLKEFDIFIKKTFEVEEG